MTIGKGIAIAAIWAATAAICIALKDSTPVIFALFSTFVVAVWA